MTTTGIAARNWTTAHWRVTARVGAVALPPVAGAALYALRDHITATIGALILVLLVVAAAGTGDRLAGLLAAVSAGAWFDFYLTAPPLTFTIDSTDDIEATMLLIIISVAVTEVALWGRRQQARASRRSGYLDGILAAAQAVAQARAANPMVTQLVAGQIADVLDAEEARFVPGPVTDPHIAVLDSEGALIRDGHQIDVERVGLPTDDYIAVPVRKGPRIVAHFLLTASAHVARPSKEQLRVAVLLADQVAAADVFPMRRFGHEGPASPT